MRKSLVRRGSGDVFRDIGFTASEAAELSTKSALIDAIAETMKRRKLTQKDAAAMAGTDQPTLSKVLRGRMESLTIDRLANWLIALGGSVEIRVRPYDSRRQPKDLIRGRLAVHVT